MGKEIQSTINLRAELTYSDTEGLPFVPSSEKTTPASLGDQQEVSSVSIKAVRGSAPRDVRLGHNYETISDKHGRSMTESATSKSVVWGGGFSGDIYGAKSLKGVAMYHNLKIINGGTADYGVAGKGLMDSACMERCVQVSEVFRRNGLPTEKPVVVMRLKELAQKAKEKDVWEKVLVEDWKEENLRKLRSGGWDQYKKVVKYFAETNFLAMERHVQVDERIRDLEHLPGRRFSVLTEFMEPIFKWLNVATKYRKNGLITGTPQPEQFDTSPDSIERYFSEFLPNQIGTYLGRIHKLGIVHRYAHSQNWSMVGTMYDLDSPAGKLIYPDDDVPKGSEYVEDICTTITDCGTVIGQVLEANFNSSYLQNIKNETQAKIARSYIKEKYGFLNVFTKMAFKSTYTKNGDWFDNDRMKNIWPLL